MSPHQDGEVTSGADPASRVQLITSTVDSLTEGDMAQLDLPKATSTSGWLQVYRQRGTMRLVCPTDGSLPTAALTMMDEAGLSNPGSDDYDGDEIEWPSSRTAAFLEALLTAMNGSPAYSVTASTL